MGQRSDFCVVIPTLNEAARLQGTVDAARVAFKGRAAAFFVVDGGSQDETVRVAQRLGCHVLTAPRGRGPQLRAGAEAAMAMLEDDGVLVFLHADTIMPPEAGKALSDHFSNPVHNVALFRARFDRGGPILGIYAWFTRFDTYWTSFGDQIISIRKRFYAEIDGFPPWPIFEDVGLLQEARRYTRIARMPVWVTTSARMFDAVGQIRQQLRNAWLMIRFRIGASPESFFKTYYRPLRESDEGRTREQREIDDAGDPQTDGHQD